MADTSRTQDRHRAASDQFRPKFLTLLREGYSTRALRADAFAGLTVAIVALPLSMAIAIASGVGPAGAFIVLVAACVAATGIEGLVLATLLSGVLLIAAGALRPKPRSGGLSTARPVFLWRGGTARRGAGPGRRPSARLCG